MGEAEVSLRDTKFLRTDGVLRQFIDGFSRLAVPMTRLTRKGVKFEWDDLCEKAFQELKWKFTIAPIPVVPE